MQRHHQLQASDQIWVDRKELELKKQILFFFVISKIIEI